MIKAKNSYPRLTSIGPYDNEIYHLTKRNYKYIRSAQQFSKGKASPPLLAPLFFKKLKSAKLLYRLNLNWDYDTQKDIRKEIVLNIYRKHGNALKQADVTFGSISQHYFFPKFFLLLKNIRQISLIDHPQDIKIIPILHKLDVLTLHILGKIETFVEFARSVIRTKGPKTLKLVISSSLLDSFESIKHIMPQLLSKVESIESFLYLNTDSQSAADLLKLSEQKITNISLLSSSSKIFLPHFLQGCQSMKHLQSLTIQIKDSSESLIENLGYIQQCNRLQLLDIAIYSKPTSSLVEKILVSLKFPSSLTGFRLEVPLVIAPLVVKNKQVLVVFEKENTIDDSVNIFEDEPSFVAFYKALEAVKKLKYISLTFRIGELFLSPYTNFFSSIIKRIQNIETIKFQVREEDVEVPPDSQIEERGENCFNLALFFDCCPNLPKLRALEINMPNYYFGYINLLQKFPQLNKFVINNQETLFFEKISQQIDRVVKSLPLNNLEALDFGFTEILSQSSLIKRIVGFKKFKNLRYLSLRYKLMKVEAGIVKALSQAIQGLKALQFLYLAFENEEIDFLGFRQALKYNHTIKDAYVCFINPLQ